jgi:U3 small nucleolar RNA-associated protein 19
MAAEKRKRPTSSSTDATSNRKKKSPRDEVERLEAEIQQSRQNYNNIAKLVAMAKQQDTNAMVALCRVFCRLIAGGNLRKSKDTPQNEVVIVQWLKERYSEYTNLLLETLDSSILKLAMRLVKEESREDGDSAWKFGFFGRLVQTLFLGEHAEPILQDFMREWAFVYDDVRFYTFQKIP